LYFFSRFSRLSLLALRLLRASQRCAIYCKAVDVNFVTLKGDLLMKSLSRKEINESMANILLQKI
jgi:hypothetical protein